MYKNSEFCKKTSKFLSKKCLFIFCNFYLKRKELNQQVCLIKYVEIEISNSTSHKKKKERKRERERERERECEREEQKHNSTSKTFLKPLKNFH